MVRKTSDIALLLGSRGRTRTRSGLSKFVRGVFDSWFGRSMWREERSARSTQVPGWAALLLVALAFGGGYLVGGRLGGVPPAKNDLRMKPSAAGFVGEFDARPIHQKAFIVGAYPKLAPADAKAAAKQLADWLVDQKLDKARPFEYPAKDGPLWVVAVYFEGDAELIATRNRLLALTDVPDASFVHLRNTEAEWPKSWTVQ